MVRAGLRHEPNTGDVPPPRSGGDGVRRAADRPRSGIVIGLHHNTGNDGKEFDESVTGLDHIGFAVPSRAELDTWTARLDELGIDHSGVRDITEPIPFSTLVFRDPDNIQLELYADA